MQGERSPVQVEDPSTETNFFLSDPNRKVMRLI